MKKFVLLLVLSLVTTAQAGVQVRRSFVEKTWTPGTVAGTYTAGKQVGGVSTLTGVPQDAGGFANLWGVSAVDYEHRNAAIDLLFFNASPSLASVDGGQFDIGGASAAPVYVGKVSFPAANYLSSARASLGQVTGTALPLPLKVAAASGNSLYAVAVVTTAGAAAWSGVTSLQFKLYFGQE